MTKQQKIQFLLYVRNRICQVASTEVATFIACQFALESNFGQSLLATRHNNLCGMKHPTYRVSLSISRSTAGYACYLNHDDCITDYMIWLAYNHIGKYDLSHLDLFKKTLVAKGYCPDKDYISRIENLYSTYYQLISNL